MKLVSYHARTQDSFDFDAFIAGLCEASNYVPLIATTREALARRLDPFEVGLPMLPTTREALAPKDGSTLLLARLQRVGPDGHRYLELLGLGEGVPPKVQAFVAAMEDPGLELAPGPVTGAWKTDRLREWLGEPGWQASPLADPAFRTGLEHLKDDGVRHDLGQLAAVVGRNPIPLDRLEELEAFAASGSSLNRILHEATLIERRFVVTCRECGALLAFAERERARRAVADAVGRCASCGEERLRIAENCAFTEAFVRAVEEGLWLTALAGTALAERGWAVWPHPRSAAGMDLLAVYLDQTLFIACRDGDLDPGDLACTLMEARSLEADLCLILSTASLPPGMRTAADRAGSRPRCRIISHSTAARLRRELDTALGAIRQAYVAQWLLSAAGDLQAAGGPVLAAAPAAEAATAATPEELPAPQFDAVADAISQLA